MSKIYWRFTIEFSNGDQETGEEYYNSPEEAEEAAYQWISDYHQGMEVLNMIGDEVYEVDDDPYVDIWEDEVLDPGEN